MILPPFALVPLIIIFRNDSKYLSWFVIALIGIESTTVLLLFLLEVKKRIKVFALSSIPILSLWFWIFVYVPFFVILPGALIIWGDTNSGLVNIISTGTAFLWFLTMGAVTVFSIVLNEVFKRIEIRKASQVLHYLHESWARRHLRQVWDHAAQNHIRPETSSTESQSKTSEPICLEATLSTSGRSTKTTLKTSSTASVLSTKQMLAKLNKLREKSEEAQRK